MDQRKYVITLLLAMTLCCTATIYDRPHIIFILADDLVSVLYVVGSKSFRPDIQKPRQMENAVRDI